MYHFKAVSLGVAISLIGFYLCVLKKTGYLFIQVVQLSLSFCFTGLVDWKEYYTHFLLAKGYPLEQAKQHVVDYEAIELDYSGTLRVLGLYTTLK